jgi:hypothetical protein
MADVEKFLFFKLDEEHHVFFPERFSDVPVVFDTTIPEEERQNYKQVKMTGDPMELHMLEMLMFMQEDEDPFEGIFDAENNLAEKHDNRGEISAHRPSAS